MHVHLNQDPPDSKMEDSAQDRRRGGREGVSSQKEIAIIRIGRVVIYVYCVLLLLFTTPLWSKNDYSHCREEETEV